MSAYAKLSLVTSVFHASDVAFVRGWSRAAPGIGGWTVLFDNDVVAEQVSIIPPGSVHPVFFITRNARDVLLERRRSVGDDDEVVEAGRFDNLREAVLALCPVADEALEDIKLDLEKQFPRHDRT